MSDDVEALYEEIKALPAPDRLRLAAELLENQRPEMARLIALRVVTELGAALALRDLEQRKYPRP